MLESPVVLSPHFSFGNFVESSSSDSGVPFRSKDSVSQDLGDTLKKLDLNQEPFKLMSRERAIAKVKALYQVIESLNKDHAEALQDLHQEIHRLQTQCSGGSPFKSNFCF